MPNITFDSNSYYLDGKPFFFYSGEVPYFRVPRKDWRFRLQKLKDAGANCVSTYIPWGFHEPEEGAVSFEPHTQKDLDGFLELCGEIGLFVVCRPGPNCYSELRFEGLPDWLCENYPQIRARDFDGKPFRSSSVSYLHPVFLQKAKKWYDAVLPVIQKHTISKGGTVAFIQLDNEVGGIHEWTWGGYDYNPQTIGRYEENGRYPCFLKRRYSTIEELNRHYGTDFSGFAQVEYGKTNDPSTLYEARRYEDYLHFTFEMEAEYLETLANWCGEYIDDCILIHNSGTGIMNPHFQETAEKLGKKFLLGSDHYYNLGSHWPQNNPTPQYVSQCFLSMEMLRMMGFPPSVFEFPAGSIGSWPPITYQDMSCNGIAHLAFGAKGFNYYIFSGGPNPERMGSTVTDYDYSAPIGSKNQIRPHYAAVEEIGRYVTENRDLTLSKRVTDLKIAIDLEHIRSDYYKKDMGFGLGHKELYQFLHLGLVCTAFCGSYSPEILDIHSPDTFGDLSTPLIVPSSAVMARSVQQNLVSFLEKGGKLLILPMLPELDEQFSPCTILRDYLGGGETRPFSYDLPLFELEHFGTAIKSQGKLYETAVLPDGANRLGFDPITGKLASWEKETENGGKAIWLGFHWNYCDEGQTRMLEFVLSRLGYDGHKAVECDNPNLWAVLRTTDRRAVVYVMNLFTQEMSGTVSLDLPKGRETKAVNVPAMSVLTLEFSL